MKFFDNFKVKKCKNNYKTLLELKNSLDDISLKVSILNDRILSYKKNLSLSFDKINDYMTKIFIASKKNNSSLCKKGFIKYYKETLVYDKSTKIYDKLEVSYNLLVDDLTALQDLYSAIEENYSQQDFSTTSFFSDPTKVLINDFSKKLSQMESLVSEIHSFVPNKYSTLEDIEEKTLFKNEDEFLKTFSKFLEENNI